MSSRFVLEDQYGSGYGSGISNTVIIEKRGDREVRRMVIPNVRLGGVEKGRLEAFLNARKCDCKKVK